MERGQFSLISGQFANYCPLLEKSWCSLLKLLLPCFSRSNFSRHLSSPAIFAIEHEAAELAIPFLHSSCFSNAFHCEWRFTLCLFEKRASRKHSCCFFNAFYLLAFQKGKNAKF